MSATTSGVFAGLSQDALRANLASAQGALHQLLTGAKVVQAEFAMGDGSRKVTYNSASTTQLRGYIGELQRLLGIASPRRAVGLRF